VRGERLWLAPASRCANAAAVAKELADVELAVHLSDSTPPSTAYDSLVVLLGEAATPAEAAAALVTARTHGHFFLLAAPGGVLFSQGFVASLLGDARFRLCPVTDSHWASGRVWVVCDPAQAAAAAPVQWLAAGNVSASSGSSSGAGADADDL